MRVPEPVKQWDLARTLLELAGLDGEGFPGTNLLAPEALGGPRFGLAAHAHEATVQQSRWFLVLHLRQHGRGFPPRTLKQHQVELFDLEADPLCLMDVSAEHPETTARLRATLVEWLSEAAPERLARTSASQNTDALEQLAALGYATGDDAAGDATWIDLDCDCDRCAPFR